MKRDDGRAERIVKNIGGWMIVIFAVLFLVTRLGSLWSRANP